jgi:hypothetical protein
MGSPIEVAFVIVAMSLWFVFPVGLFIAMNHIDRSVDGVVQLGNDPAGMPAKVKPEMNKPSSHWRPHWPMFIQRLRHH